MKNFRRRVKEFWVRQDAATLPEYAVVAALIATGLAAAILSIGDGIQELLKEAPQALTDCAQLPSQVDCIDASPLD